MGAGYLLTCVLEARPQEVRDAGIARDDERLHHSSIGPVANGWLSDGREIAEYDYPACDYHIGSNGGVKMPTAAYETIAQTIKNRRSNLNVDTERAVPDELVQELLDLATWAPNHYRTNPHRFAVLTGAARARVGEVVAKAVAAKPDAKEAVVERQRVQFLRAPTVVVAASAPDEDPVKHFENKYAVAAGVQNLLLAAEAAGLAAAWRSGPAMVEPDVTAVAKEAMGLAPEDEIVAFVYLGYPIAPPGVREKPETNVRHVTA